ncbi:MAG: hypothetical protein HY056_15815 [Proteobacteria bacterium]|nr:hypothetical protein [Pseudomonadota bacterium]
MIKLTSAVLAAGLIASAIAALPGFIPGVEAHAVLPVVNVATKADRLDTRAYGHDCSIQAWPYYETTCLRQSQAQGGARRVVRVVAIDNFGPR